MESIYYVMHDNLSACLMYREGISYYHGHMLIARFVNTCVAERVAELLNKDLKVKLKKQKKRKK